MSEPNTAGPLLHATLLAAALDPIVASYAGLGLVPVRRGTIDAAQAAGWRQPALAGAHFAELAPAGGATLLRLIERPGAVPQPTRTRHGWLALEVLVRDVDSLAPRAAAAGFEIVGPPADLEVSPAIRAMQLIGPAGEMLYLTQIKQAVPPFELPLSPALNTDLGPLFIGVMSVASREAALAACAPMVPKAVLRFDTKVTVLNRAMGEAIDHRWPVATVQWVGENLFEIDEVVHERVLPAAADEAMPPDGLAWLTMRSRGRAAGLQRLAPGVWLETVD